MHISDRRDMVCETQKQRSGGNVNIFNRNNENLVLDSKIKLSKIEYGFLSSKLLFVALITSDPKKGIIEGTVVLKFGKKRKKEQAGNFYWIADYTNIIIHSGGSGKPMVLMIV
jgi:hypothetical protein